MINLYMPFDVYDKCSSSVIAKNGIYYQIAWWVFMHHNWLKLSSMSNYFEIFKLFMHFYSFFKQLQVTLMFSDFVLKVPSNYEVLCTS